MDPTHPGPDEDNQHAPGAAGGPRRAAGRGTQPAATGPHDRDRTGRAAASPGLTAASPGLAAGTAGRATASPGLGAGSAAGLARTAELTSGEYLLTVNPVDGSEIEQCPPGSPRHPAAPTRHSPGERAALRRAQAAARSTVTAGAGAIATYTARGELPLLERDEERDRLVRLLGRGRSVRLTAPSGAGRTALLDAVADGCADFAPDGVIRLSGYRSTPTDLLHALCSAVYKMPAHRPDRAQLLELARDIGAVVVLDDVEFDGTALDDFLDATPECAFLISATPEVSAPSPGAYLEEVALGGLSRTACMELLGRLVRRPPTDEEAAWAADLWFESEGLPLRFVQAAALLRGRDRAGGVPAEPADAVPTGAVPTGVVPSDAVPSDLASSDAAPSDGAQGSASVAKRGTAGGAPERRAGAGSGAGADAIGAPTAAGPATGAGPAATAPAAPPALTLTDGVAPAALLAGLISPAAREALQFALALGGECPHPAHLPALIGDAQADAAVAELLDCGLVTQAGDHYRLGTGVAAQLTAAGLAQDPATRALTAAQHYAWWAGHPSVAAARAVEEADAMLGALAALVTARATHTAPADGASGTSGTAGAKGTSGASGGSGAADTGGQRVGQLSAAVLLARTAAPAFAAGLHWSAWERCLRHGQEAARLAGEVAEEAYFHHELGVLALCTDQVDRARAELEAAISLRGVLADRRGAVAGRRALALVVDRTGISAPGGLDTLGALTGGVEPAAEPQTGGPAGAPGADDPTAELPPTADDDTLRGAAVGAAAAAHGATGTGRAGAGAAKGAAGAGAATGGWRASVRRLPLVVKARRNLAAAGAGALLVAVLGAVVTLGATSGDEGDPDRVAPRKSILRQEEPAPDEEETGDEPSRNVPGDTGRPGGATAPGAPNAPRPSSSTGASGSPDETPSTSGTPTTDAPTDTGSPTDPDPEPTAPTTRPSDPPPTRPTDPPTKPTDPPTKPTDPPTEPTDPPTEPTDPPTTAPTTDTPPQSPSQLTEDPGPR